MCLTEKALLEAHRLLSRAIVVKSKQGKYRQEAIGVFSDRFWRLLSEKNYRIHQQEYYDYINLGVNFYVLDYSKALPIRTFESSTNQK